MKAHQLYQSRCPTPLRSRAKCTPLRSVNKAVEAPQWILQGSWGTSEYPPQVYVACTDIAIFHQACKDEVWGKNRSLGWCYTCFIHVFFFQLLIHVWYIYTVCIYILETLGTRTTKKTKRHHTISKVKTKTHASAVGFWTKQRKTVFFSKFFVLFCCKACDTR